MDKEIIKAFLEKPSPKFYVDPYQEEGNNINIGLIMFIRKDVSEGFKLHFYDYSGVLVKTYTYPTLKDLDTSFSFILQF